MQKYFTDWQRGVVIVNSYNFSMERVLEVRSNKEKGIMEVFAKVQNELQKQKLILTNLVKDYELFKISGLKGINIYELKQQSLYKQSIEEQIEQINYEIAKTNQQLEQIRSELVTAQKDRKIMEKLKEKDFYNYKENIKALEQKELDEMAILKFNRI